MEDTQTIIYMVSDLHGSQERSIFVPVRVPLDNNTLYEVSIKFTARRVTLSVHTNLGQYVNGDDWSNVTPFAEQPSTEISIGGKNSDEGYFVGCISRVSINSIELPLNGLLTTGSFSGSIDGENIEPNCNLCDKATCTSNLECVPASGVGETECRCPTGHVFDGSQEKCIATEPTPSGISPSPEPTGLPIYVIVGGAVGGVVAIGVVVIILIVIIRVTHAKRDRRKRTYSVHSLNAELRNGYARSNQYEYTPQPRRDEPALGLTSLAGSCATSKRGSSVSTYQEHAEDADPELDTPRRYSRRKSTTSVESGIKTDTDRDPSIRSREIPRMDDSGNERDTDYSPPESESDDLTSSCCMETALSPVGVQLAGSSNDLMGIPPGGNLRSPLTPQERKIITPLRPPSCDVLEHHNEETDVEETVFTYNTHDSPTRSSMPIVLSRPARTNSDSDKTSRSSTPKWYKSSTASDTEREKERIQNTRSYYTSRTSPTHTYTHSTVAPDYRPPPPSFSERKSTSPLNPNTRSRMLSSTIDSPLARNTHKYENHPLPYADLPVRQRRHEYDQVHEPLSRNDSHGRGDGARSHQAMRYTQIQKPYSSTMATRRQNSGDSHHSRYYNHPMMTSTLPTHFRGGAPSRSFSTGDAPPSESEQHFQDLKSVSTINPISYWEMQDRMKAAVDQVDPYQVLSEPFVQFEDVSTSPSVTESQITLEEPIGPEHQVFESQGGGEGAADMVNPTIDISLNRMQDVDLDSVMTESDIGQGIKHFPSADCSDEYTATLVASTSSSGDSTPKMQPRNGFNMPLSQRSFDV